MKKKLMWLVTALVVLSMIKVTTSTQLSLQPREDAVSGDNGGILLEVRDKMEILKQHKATHRKKVDAADDDADADDGDNDDEEDNDDEGDSGDNDDNEDDSDDADEQGKRRQHPIQPTPIEKQEQAQESQQSAVPSNADLERFREPIIAPVTVKSLASFHPHPPSAGPCHQAPITATTATCPGFQIRYWFNKETSNCEPFNSCQQSLFGTKEECHKSCLVSEACLAPLKLTNCVGGKIAYFYNQLTKQCEQYVACGSSGNLNHFSNRVECKVTCFAPWSTAQLQWKSNALERVSSLRIEQQQTLRVQEEEWNNKWSVLESTIDQELASLQLHN